MLGLAEVGEEGLERVVGVVEGDEAIAGDASRTRIDGSAGGPGDRRDAELYVQSAIGAQALLTHRAIAPCLLRRLPGARRRVVWARSAA